MLGLKKLKLVYGSMQIATKEERAMKKYPYLMKRINDIEKEIKKLKKK
jgi:cell division protein FtsB